MDNGLCLRMVTAGCAAVTSALAGIEILVSARAAQRVGLGGHEGVDERGQQVAQQVGEAANALPGRRATGRREPVADRIVSATGFRPHHTVAAELRLDLDSAAVTHLQVGADTDVGDRASQSITDTSAAGSRTRTARIWPISAPHISR
jgi:hypothetical protein